MVDRAAGQAARGYRILELPDRPHSKILLTADYADNADKHQNICDQMVKHSALGGSA